MEIVIPEGTIPGVLLGLIGLIVLGAVGYGIGTLVGWEKPSMGAWMWVGTIVGGTAGALLGWWLGHL